MPFDSVHPTLPQQRQREHVLARLAGDFLFAFLRATWRVWLLLLLFGVPLGIPGA